MDVQPGPPVPPHQLRRRRLQTFGWAVLALGIAGAGLTYWNGLHQGPTTEDLIPGTLRARRRQMGILYGTIGEMTVELTEDLKVPVVQAGLILAGGVISAAVCFYLAGSEGRADDERPA
jgi:hypothetical protein